MPGKPWLFSIILYSSQEAHMSLGRLKTLLFNENSQKILLNFMENVENIYQLCLRAKRNVGASSACEL
jgi:hypothetical protein